MRGERGRGREREMEERGQRQREREREESRPERRSQRHFDTSKAAHTLCLSHREDREEEGGRTEKDDRVFIAEDLRGRLVAERSQSLCSQLLRLGEGGRESAARIVTEKFPPEGVDLLTDPGLQGDGALFIFRDEGLVDAERLEPTEPTGKDVEGQARVGRDQARVLPPERQQALLTESERREDRREELVELRCVQSRCLEGGVRAAAPLPHQEVQTLVAEESHPARVVWRLDEGRGAQMHHTVQLVEVLSALIESAAGQSLASCGVAVSVTDLVQKGWRTKAASRSWPREDTEAEQLQMMSEKRDFSEGAMTSSGATVLPSARVTLLPLCSCPKSGPMGTPSSFALAMSNFPGSTFVSMA
jgi:hypothetical protein